MCRFVLYIGEPTTLDTLITLPAHSIIHQSFQSKFRREPLNGDGFGMAWYVPEISKEPALFKDTQPAWSNLNLRNLTRVTKSSVVFAHVRAATRGQVSQENCHPFTKENLTFMHNGNVPEFPRIKRGLIEHLSDESFNLIQGSTDSEHLFALFWDQLKNEKKPYRIEALRNALRETISRVAVMVDEYGISETMYLNLVISDGQSSVVSRYMKGKGEPESLFVRTGSRYVCEGSVCRMIDEKGTKRTVIVASEPLTDNPGWEEVPENHLLLIDSDRKVHREAI